MQGKSKLMNQQSLRTISAICLTQSTVESDVFLPVRVVEEDYFNRSAIIHGMMRCSYGPKDSTKASMAFMFLVFAFDEEGQTEP